MVRMEWRHDVSSSSRIPLSMMDLWAPLSNKARTNFVPTLVFKLIIAVGRAEVYRQPAATEFKVYTLVGLFAVELVAWVAVPFLLEALSLSDLWCLPLLLLRASWWPVFLHILHNGSFSEQFVAWWPTFEHFYQICSSNTRSFPASVVWYVMHQYTEWASEQKIHQDVPTWKETLVVCGLGYFTWFSQGWLTFCGDL